MNVVTLIGNLATDIELKDVAPDKKVASFLLAVDRPGKDAGADFVQRLDLEPAGGGLRRVPVEGGAGRPSTGRLRSRSWEDADGKRRSAVEVVANRVEFLDTRNRKGVAVRGRRVVGSRAVARRDEIVAFADELLEVEAFPEYGRPGLQVVGADDVSKLACGVSSSRELFERAGSRGRAARARPPRPLLAQRAAASSTGG